MTPPSARSSSMSYSFWISMMEPSYLRPRDIPRDLTLNPVAFATIDCSKLIFEPSANEVTIAAFCPQRSAQPCWRSEEHTSELQSLTNIVCRLLLEKKK